MDLAANPNTHWASILVDELARCGLEAVCMAPGSRSTPLVLAFAAHPTIRLYRHLDERSAGFFALGLAQASGRPVALVCTSGTAAANFHPAVIEAYYAYIPLLVLTADRPPELRQSGANQTIDQVKMFGDHVRWALELPTPQPDAPEVVLRHLRTVAARAYATAGGLTKGPVHLNFPFRKPLEPGEPANGRAQPVLHRPVETRAPFTQISRGTISPDDSQIAAVAAALAGRRVVIVCGPGCPGGDFPSAVAELAERYGAPILADALSNVRCGNHVAGGVVFGGYNLWLSAAAAHLPRPDVVLRFGAVPTSAALAGWLEAIAPPNHIHVREDGEWADDLHLTHTLVQVNPALFCRSLAEALGAPATAPEVWVTALREIEARTWTLLDEQPSGRGFYDGGALHRVLDALPEDAALFAGNSMPVRYVDTFLRPAGRRLMVFGNRGASGIDGNTSTALGIAAATGKAVVALLGDITFYHDMNGLLAIRQHGLTNVTFIVTNNDGGGIFHRLPVARHDPPFTELFLTPHGLKFEHAAAMYGLDYSTVADDEELANALKSTPGQPRLIEIHTDSSTDYERHRAILSTVAGELQPIVARLFSSRVTTARLS